MKNRTIPGSILVMVAMAALSCSKTQDTAPERRVFGDPPVIETVEQAFFDPQKALDCDASFAAFAWVAQFYGPPTFIAGTGWQLKEPHDSGPMSSAPGVFITGTYGSVTLKVKVSDPNSPPPPGQTNILLVSASYPNPDPDKHTESTLVLFDDGSVNKFHFPQRYTSVGEYCICDFFGNCTCYQDKIDVDSGDRQAGDGEYTRKLALADKRTVQTPVDGVFQDCIMHSAGITTFLTTAGWTWDFKIEAVDRQGNLTTWPVRLKALVEQGSFVCSGDPCGCCVLQSSDPAAECHGLEGSVAPGAPSGACFTF